MEKLPECSVTVPTPPGVSGACPKLPEPLRKAITQVTLSNLIAVPSYDLEIIQVPPEFRGLSFPMYIQRNTESGKMRLISFYASSDDRRTAITNVAKQIQSNETVVVGLLQKFLSLSQNSKHKLAIQKDLVKINAAQIAMVKANAELERAKTAREDVIASLFP